MAKMKIEVLAQRHRSLRPSLKDQMIAGLPSWAAYVSYLPGLSNWASKQSLLRQALQALTGIAAKGRSLPHWAAKPFHRSHGLKREAVAEDLKALKMSPTQPTVILWSDSFNNYFEPEILRDAMMVLEAAGCRVIAQHQLSGGRKPLCCGRSSFACGDIEAAQIQLEHMLDCLGPWIEAGAWVVGVEPSCLLTMRDELLSMRLSEHHRSLASLLATRALLLEEYLEQELQAGRLSLHFQALEGQRAWLHGHCHQKAFGAFPAAVSMLTQIPGLKVVPITSSCCGMAGSFGYEAEHHAVSLAMAEAALLPAVRAAPAALVVADGTSCRHQVRDAAGREAVHVARVLAQALR